MKVDPLLLENAVIGYPLGHTLSPALHNLVYEKMGIRAILRPLLHQNLREICRIIHEFPLQLIAVTIPYKQMIMKYLDHIDSVAHKIGAVNTVINRKGKLFGYNTDIVGIAKALQAIQLKDKTVLILGAGGAARPVALYVQQQGGQLLFRNRTLERAETLVQVFGGKIVSLEDLRAEDLDVIINTTSLGMHPHVNESPLPLNLLAPHQTVFDLVYSPYETKFLKDAKSAGAHIIHGLTMFIAQGLEQIRLWTGQHPSAVGLETLLKNLLINVIKS